MTQLSPLLISRLQAQAGNGAVARLVVQRRELVSPAADPKFQSLTKGVRGAQKRLSAHPPAQGEADKAAKAAKAPPDDKQAQAKTKQADKMEAAKPGEFNKAAFIAAVNEAIAKQAPKNLNEAKDYGESGKANAIKGEVSGKVTAGKKGSAAPIESTTKQAPDTSKAKDKPVTPLTPDKPPATPPAPNAALAVPDKAPPADTDFSAGPKQVDSEMTEAGVTESQLAKSNEPEFTGALEAKKEGEEHSATAPKQLRASEAQTLGAAKADAAATGAKSMSSMAATRKVLGAAVAGGKQGAKSADELKRAKVNAILQKVFDTTKTQVEVILNGIDEQVDSAFDTGEKAARDAFTAEHTQNMKAYKKKRYSGVRGKLRWVRDKFRGLPAEANKIFDVARRGYVDRMKRVIANVAEVIARELNRAKGRIAQGRKDLQAEVTKLPKDLKAMGKKAAGEFAEKFDELGESVDNKGSELVQTLAGKYKDALGKVDEEIEAEKEKNSGLIAKAINAVKGVIKAILELKDLLLGVLAKAAEAALAIISDPIGFLGNLISAVGDGLSAFMSRLGEHLKKGLVSWLLGSAGSMGIEIPKKFDLPGIIGMVAGMLGLTWDAIKARVIARGIPAKAIELAEGSLPLIARIRSAGIGGIADMIVQRVGDLKETLFTKISEYLVPEVLKAGIVWILSLLNPASAFIKACKMIIDIVTFIVTRGKQIIEFVHAVLDAVIAIAKGGAGGVPALIENALSKSIPVLIGALASILGVTGIADKVKKFIQGLSKPVMKAVNWVTDKIVGVGKAAWNKLKNSKVGKAFGAAKDKAKAAYAKGKAYVKKKYEAGKAYVKKKYEGAKAWAKGKLYDDSPAGKQKRLDEGLAAGVAAANKYSGKSVSDVVLRPALGIIKFKKGLQTLEPVKAGEVWAVHAEVQRAAANTSAKVGTAVPDGTPFAPAPKPNAVDKYGRATGGSAELEYRATKVNAPRGATRPAGSWLLAKMVAGHLIPHSFGGHYVRENLVAIRKAVNDANFTKIEGVVRKAFRGKADAKASYITQCHYNESGPADLESWITANFAIGPRANLENLGDKIFEMTGTEDVRMWTKIAKLLDIKWADFNSDKLKNKLARLYLAKGFTITVTGDGATSSTFDNVL